MLTIATTDSSGGAGIPADLKTMLANDVFGECVVAGITAQNTTGVQAIAAVNYSIVGAQIDSVFDDIRPTAVKIGVIVGVESVKTVARKLRTTRPRTSWSTRSWWPQVGRVLPRTTQSPRKSAVSSRLPR